MTWTRSTFDTSSATTTGPTPIILDRAAQAGDADYHASQPGLSFESLHNTLAHVLLSEIAWQVRWDSEPPYRDLPNARGTLEITRAQLKTLPELRERWSQLEQVRKTMLDRLTDEKVNAPRAYVLSDGTRHSQPLGHQFAHLVNHGTQFRAEAAVRLTQLGLSPGEIDLSIYFRGHAGD